MSEYEDYTKNFQAMSRLNDLMGECVPKELQTDQASNDIAAMFALIESHRNLQSEVERLRGRCEELESALKPFAEEAEYMPDYAVDIHLNYIMDDAEVLERASFTAENIHAAAQRLRQQASEIEGGGQ